MAENFDVTPNAETWHNFIGLFMRGAVAAAVVLALMGLFLL